MGVQKDTQEGRRPQTIAVKKTALRHNEYYDMQGVYDELYAKSKKGQLFYNLYDIIADERNILLAYCNIKKNHGSRTPGVNSHTIQYWEDNSVDSYVEYVQKRLQNYFPHSVRRVEIPKLNGGKRPLGIPSIEDRLIQQCIKQVLEPICEAKFHPHSYGFRPNRSAKHAVAAFVQRVNIGKLYYIVDVDIKGFFDNVDHGKLLKQLWTLGIRDKRVISIISKMLKAKVEGIGFPKAGTPQGGILSPLLANVVLNEFDWWIESQWSSMPALSGRYKPNINQKGVLIKSNLYGGMRKFTNLKEVYLVRYADDFKLICRKYVDAQRIYHAAKRWLKDRLNLEISEEKSKVIDIRSNSSEFLGFRFKAQPKGKEADGSTKYVIQSHMRDKAKNKAVKDLCEKIKAMQKEPSVGNVSKYNSTVLGLQNYYKIATQCSQDFGEINFKTRIALHNRLKDVATEAGKCSYTYDFYYKGYNYPKCFVKEICLFPIAGIAHKSPILFQQGICDYTEEGRILIHQKLRMDVKILRYVMEHPLPDGSIELNDNRLSLFVAQKGRCSVTSKYLKIGEMELHHIKPKEQGGTDEYKNLTWISYDVHKLIHATEPETIAKYLALVHLGKNELIKLNKYRVAVGNTEIK